MSNASDFVIENGVLKEYTGPGGDVVIPEGVTGISGRLSDWDCRMVFRCGDCLTSISIPDSVTRIDDCAFEGCSSLASIKIPNSVTNIGYCAFEGCSSLTSVEIPNSVTSIGYNAFRGCRNLTSIKIPDSVNEIGRSAFSDTAYFNNSSNWENGALYIGNHLIAVENYDIPFAYTMEPYIIREGTRCISEATFSECSRLRRVVLPTSITSIAASAFYKCNNLMHIEIPGGVTRIGRRAFWCCNSLTSITIPEGVTCIGNLAFAACSSLTSITIPNSVTDIDGSAFRGCSGLTSIEIPDSVTSIGSETFFNCSGLTHITIPHGVTSIGEKAFYDCKNLTSISIPDSITSIDSTAFFGCRKLNKIFVRNSQDGEGKDILDISMRPVLLRYLDAFSMCFTDAQVKKHILVPGVWDKLSLDTQTKMFCAHSGKSLEGAYTRCVNDVEAMGTAILNFKTRELKAVARFMILFSQDIPVVLLKTMHKAIRLHSATVDKMIEADAVLMDRLNAKEQLSAADEKLERILLKRNQSPTEILENLSKYYYLSASSIPNLKCKDGLTASECVIAWLLTVHEELDEKQKGNFKDVFVQYQQPGLCPEAAEIAAELDPTGFQNYLRSLTNKLGHRGRSREMFLAYPICRYADEALMAELTQNAPKWASHSSGIDAPALATFRTANAYSNTRAAMLFAEKYHELDKYAALRGTTAEVIRDQVLSNIGIDENGGKVYDLGTQLVTAKLQTDLSFLIELPNGKTAKSLPKKGADEDKFITAKEDFANMKKYAKKIVKSRCNLLFEQFLSCKATAAETWKGCYLHNPLLRSVAELLVWKQGNQTFTVKGNSLIDSAQHPVSLGTAPICLAHPMEMQQDDVAAWQKYFTAHQLKQPFTQIWEPLVDFTTIKEDRYAGIEFPAYRFKGQEKHGIDIYYEEYSECYELDLKLVDCSVEIISENVVERHTFNSQGKIQLESFSCRKKSRASNHIIALLDKWAVYGWIMQDDASIVNQLPQFTLAQIEEFLKLAMDNNCANCTAALLEFKNVNFAGFNPMAEFTLEL